MSAPLVRTIEEDVPACAAAADDTTNIGQAPFAGVVTAVEYVADATLTGADTESRTVALLNKGQGGVGTTSVASLAFVATVVATAANEKAITLNATPANLVVAAGDTLQWTSTHVGSTGLADPGGLVRVTISRS